MDDLSRIVEEQERILRFPSLDFDTIGRICSGICDRVMSLGATGYVRASVNGMVVYARALAGASRNNEEWARRKANVCHRYGISSLHVVLRLARDGKTLEVCGMDNADYGLSGGSFPILFPSGIPVGSITFSGMAGEEDHQVVCDAIAAELGVDVPSIL